MANNEELKSQMRADLLDAIARVAKCKGEEDKRKIVFEMLRKIFRCPDREIQELAMFDAWENWDHLVDIKECYSQWTFTGKVSDVRYVPYDPRDYYPPSRWK